MGGGGLENKIRSLWQTGNSRIVLTVVFTVEGSGSSVTIVRATKVRGLLDGEDFLCKKLVPTRPLPLPS